ncbi:beta-galactosidase GalB [uncultured Draconibacterium sp.]|uniref:beta-galactosidase GalB n=1 Tax=uncultured Draconibacterium sp. TaxID=1573823 RepID=UPI0025F723A2|nr:beta-galactosidase GalB [uncultured Draconibacterium sp.]
MNIRNTFLLLLGFAILASCQVEQPHIADQNFNADWLFYKGDAEGAEATAFPDAEWRKLDLPHDWAIEGPFDGVKNNARTGGLPVHGTGWYRKHFTVEKAMQGKQVSIEFDGAMDDAHVWLNGQQVGNRPYGYIGFELDLTPYIKFGEENVLAVRLQPQDLAMRWYPGAGIYRNVRIKYNNPVHIPQWGTFVTTPEISAEKAVVKIRTTVKNAGQTSQVTLKTSLKDKNGAEVASAAEEVNISGEKLAETEQVLEVANPELWELETPTLYKVVSEIIQNGNVLDVYETPFGIRTIEFTPNDGFLLNGKRVLLKGVCMHHDLGALGSAFNYRARERQMEIMKSMGVNALRTSHNPPEPEWLEICDKMGILVQVEAFDEWKKGKVINGYNQYFDEWHEPDLRDMVRRDRNHPSVIMWSLGNEILEQGVADGWQLTKHLNNIVKDEDTTRPTTAGFNYYPAPFKNKLAFEIDVVGMNYWPIEYKEIKEKYPDMIVYGSETSSQTSSRGVYHLPIDPLPQRHTGHVSSYDVIVGPPWAYPPDAEWDALEAEPAALGEFIWTGFDYLGEPTPYGGRDNSTHGYWNDDWPSRSSYFAPVDLCGFPKDRYYLYQSQWTEEPMVHVLPHWNWNGMEGQNIPVFAYTNCEEVELFVNGKSYGKKVKGKDLTEIPAEFHSYPKGTYKTKYRLSWEVPYQPGVLKVIAYKNGEATIQKEIETAGKPAKVLVEADRNEISADGSDLSFLTVKLTDENGNLCPLSDNLIEFEITGAGTLVGVCNGNQRDLSSFQEPRQQAFNGLCQAIIKSSNEPGEIIVKVSSEGLENTEIKLTTK